VRTTCLGVKFSPESIALVPTSWIPRIFELLITEVYFRPFLVWKKWKFIYCSMWCHIWCHMPYMMSHTSNSTVARKRKTSQYCVRMLQENEWEQTERRWNEEETSWGEKRAIVNKSVIVKHWYVMSYMMSYHTCYDIIGHGVWRHRRVAGTQAKFRTYSNLINYWNGYDIIYDEVVTWPMTSHTVCYDIICHGVWRHRHVSGNVLHVCTYSY